MIAYVRGQLACIGTDFIILEAGGLGYRIFVSASAFQRLPAVGQEIKLFTYHHVREDAMVLYGFLTREEEEIFMHLIAISGIGPKGALTILGALEPRQLIQSIVSGDVNALTQIPGIGKKTAQRLILELRDKLSSLPATESMDVQRPADMAGGGHGDAYEALLALGYTSQEAGRALVEVRRQSAGDLTCDAFVRQALRFLMTREVK